MHKFNKSFFAFLTACIVLLSMLGISAVQARDEVSTSNISASQPAVPQSADQIRLSFSPLVKKAAPAVVNIYAKRVITRRVSPFMGDPFFQQFFGGAFGFGSVPRKQVENALGSGVIVDQEGLVVTNAHVISNADEIIVGLSDGREFSAKKIVVDEASDLAVLEIEPEKNENLPYLQLKPSETAEVGDLVIAIGNPFGVGQTVTSGIISAQARSSLNISDYNFFIQTDAAINPGNSGGPLVSMDGRVIGVNSAIYSRDGGSLGIGFAIPSEMVISVINAVKKGQANAKGIIRPWLGISVQSVTADIAESLDFKVPQGVLVTALNKESPAKKAGIQVGDVVLEINGKKIKEPAEMKFRMATIPLGDDARFKILQNSKEKIVSVKAMRPPEVPARDAQILKGRHVFEGVEVSNINPAVALELGVEKESGVVVINVPARARISRFLASGDIIRSINGVEISTVKSLKDILSRGVSSSWTLILERNGKNIQLAVR